MTTCKVKKRIIYCLVAVLAGLGIFYSVRLQPTYHCSVPLTFNCSNQPLVQIEIEGQLHTVVLDLGSVVPLMLRTSVMASLTKTPYGMRRWENWCGYMKHVPSYILPSIKIGSLLLYDMVAVDPQNDEKEDKELSEIDKAEGYLGWFFLKKVGVLLDCSKSVLYISNDFHQLREEGYDLDEMIRVPLNKSVDASVWVDTDLGIKKFIIDTGFTRNTFKRDDGEKRRPSKNIHDSPKITMTKFMMSNHDFGPLPFHLLDFVFTRFDGIIGMEFLKDHAIYVDYDEGFVYIQKTEIEGYFERETKDDDSSTRVKGSGYLSRDSEGNVNAGFRAGFEVDFR